MQPSEEIKQKLDIVDLIRDYIPLQAAGMNFRAKCPFHQEKTPSFMVSPDKQIYHCFGCGKGGDVFSFVQEIEGVDFVEALRILAPKAGVVLKRQDPKKLSARNRALDIVDLCAKYYHRVFKESKEAEWAREYLQKRGLTNEVIDEWQIGYAPDAWETVTPLLRKKGYTDQEIFQAGLSSRSQKSNKYFDRFRDRVLFPIKDVNGNNVGFTARVNPSKEETEKMGKYINSPQSDIYDKSRILFGLDKARLEIKKADQVIIVEGQMDVITAHANGFKNVVASSGTALTKEQVSMIKRYTENVALAFDMDKAGEMAAIRGISEAMKQGMSIKLIELPNGKDPDDCIRANPDDFAEAVENAKLLKEYCFDKILGKFDVNESSGQTLAIIELAPYIFMLGNKVEQDNWIKTLSERVNIREQTVREEIEKVKNNNYKQVDKYKDDYKPSVQLIQKVSKEEAISELVIALLIKHPSLYNYAVNNLRIEEMVGQENKTIYNNLILYYNNQAGKSDLAVDFIFNLNDFQVFLEGQIDQPENKEIFLQKTNKVAVLSEKEYYDFEFDQAKQELIGFFQVLKRKYIKARINEIRQMLSELEKESSSGNDNQIDSLMGELNSLSKEYQNIQEK